MQYFKSLFQNIGYLVSTNAFFFFYKCATVLYMCHCSSDYYCTSFYFLF